LVGIGTMVGISANPSLFENSLNYLIAGRLKVNKIKVIRNMIADP
jgi:hypothetical protein